MKRQRGGDPRWITAQYTSKCSRTGCATVVIPKGARAFYYPLTRSMLCEECGKAAEREFSAQLFDEGVMGG